MTGATDQDLRALNLIGSGLGSFQTLKIEENKMTEQPVDDNAWGEPEGDEEPVGGVAALSANYPELPSNPHNHVYTWSPKLPDGSMLVIRANTGQGLVEAVEAMAPLAGRLRAAWQGVTGTPQQAPQQPAQGFQAPPQGVNYNPQMPPPNQPFPGQPAWQTAGTPQAPQQAAFGGGAQQSGGDSRGPKPRPTDWPTVYRITVPFNGKDAFKEFRNANAQALRGKVAWAGKGDYWIHGDVVGGFTQYNPVAA